MIKRIKKDFQFKYDCEKIVEELDANFPIGLKKIEYLLDRVYEQYPIVDRTTVVLVVKEFLKEIRKRLVNGETLYLSGYFIETKIHFYETNSLTGIIKKMKIKMRTPKTVR
jgi:hypothetical protein